MVLTMEGNIVEEEDHITRGKDPDENLTYLLDKINPVEAGPEHEDLVIFSTREHPHYKFLYTLMSYHLSVRDIPTYFLFYNKYLSETFPDLEIDGVQVSNSFRVQSHPYLFRSGQVGYPRYDWTVNLQEEIIKVEGIDDVNFFPCFLGTLQKDYKKYSMDYRNPDVARKIQRGLFTADEVLRYCQLLVHYAERHDLTVKLVGWESTYIPHALFRYFTHSDINKDNRLEYVNLGTQRGHYFWGSSQFPYYIGASNMTRRDGGDPTLEGNGKYAGFRNEFNRYCNEILDSPERLQKVKDEIEPMLRENILGVSSGVSNLDEEEARKLQERIDACRQEGNEVFCLFGHQFYDCPLEDYAPAFEDMQDWIDKTLQIFQERDDLLILKPHPGEVKRANNQNRPNVQLSDYVEGRIDHDNIILLEPTDIKSVAMYDLIDCGLIWRSSVGPEMTAFGLPVILSGRTHLKEYVPFHQPKSIEHYRTLIDEGSSLEISSEDQTQAVLFLHFFKHYINHYVPYIKNLNYSALNPWDLEWDREALEEYFENGDMNLDAILSELALESYDNPYSVDVELERIFAE